MRFEIDINPRNELGKRASLVSKYAKQEQPEFFKDNQNIPDCALISSENCNASQALVWRSKGCEPEVIVGPRSAGSSVQTVKEINNKNKNISEL